MVMRVPGGEAAPSCTGAGRRGRDGGRACEEAEPCCPARAPGGGAVAAVSSVGSCGVAPSWARRSGGRQDPGGGRERAGRVRGSRSARWEAEPRLPGHAGRRDCDEGAGRRGRRWRMHRRRSRGPGVEQVTS